MKLNPLFLLLLTVGLAMPALADEHLPSIADTWRIVVKDGHDAEFEKAFKEHLKYRAKKGDSRAWKTYLPVIGDDLNHYIVRHCCTTYAGLDDYQAWSQKTKINDHWNENVDSHVADYSHYLVNVDLKNSHWPDEDPGFQLFGVTSWDQKSGRIGAVAKSKAELSKAAMDGGWKRYWSWSNSTGGSGGLTLVSPFLNYADMEGPAGGYAAFLAKQVGEEKASEMLSEFSDNFHGSSYTVYRLINDLSMEDK